MNWARLLEVTKELQQLAPWQWMSDDFFVLRLPKHEDIYFCNIIELENQVYGVSMIIGEESFYRYTQLVEGLTEDEYEEMNVTCQLNTMLISFEDYEKLTDRDYDLLNEHNMGTQEEEKWMKFRKQVPGCPAWHLEEKDVETCILLIEGILEVAKETKMDSNYLDQFGTEDFFSLDMETKETAKFEVGDIIINIPQMISPFELKLVKKKLPKKDKVLAMAGFMMPAPVQEKKDEQPYYPFTVVSVSEDGVVLGMEMGRYDQRFELLQRVYLKNAEMLGYIPIRMIFDSEDVVYAMGPLMEELKLKCSVEPEFFYEIKEGIFEILTNQKEQA